MKTLILNGSPRVAGDTVSLINIIASGLEGNTKIVNAYYCDISPCVDCRYCWKNRGCAINDEMQDVYKYIEECDNVVIASPIYFSELTGKLLDIGSRLQTNFCGQFFREEELNIKPKKGVVILVGGGDGKIDKAYETACTLLHHMNCFDIHDVVYSHNTNLVPALDDEQIVESINGILVFLNNKDEK
ncbi:MAG: flavodoxin family protein [Clostridia bacterium]|nr:flavodoxin family protein [Clostridia bacterium]